MNKSGWLYFLFLGSALFLLSSNGYALDCNCSPAVVAGNDQPVTNTYNLGFSPGQFIFIYDTQNIPDHLIVTNGAVTLLDTTCVSTHVNSLAVTLSYSGPSSIQVLVLPNCNGSQNQTYWEYEMNWCPYTTFPTCTPTMTPTFTSTATPTMTFTITNTPTQTFTPTFTNTPTITYTPTNTFTLTNTFTPTNTYTITNTPTITNTFTPSPTFTPTCVSYVWPNPYNPQYAFNNSLKISCLPTGSTVNFYTLSGELVNQANEAEGMAQWKGINTQGIPVSSGIYYYVIQNGTNVLGRGKFLLSH